MSIVDDVDDVMECVGVGIGVDIPPLRGSRISQFLIDKGFLRSTVRSTDTTQCSVVQLQLRLPS